MKRTFTSGANRNSSDGKLEYHGFNHPVLEQKFAEYMHKHRELEDGTLRDSNNWWKGWDKSISLHSLNRHLQDLNALHAGYVVIKFKTEKGEHTKYITKDESLKFLGMPTVDIVTEEECCAAIRFNSMAYLLHIVNNPMGETTSNDVQRIDLTAEDDTDYSTKTDL